MKVRWADDPILGSVARIYVEAGEAVEYMFVGEWAGPGEPPDRCVAEIKRRLERQLPGELERFLESAPLPSVSLAEIERRMQNAYGLRDQHNLGDLLEAVRQSSRDVRDLLAVLSGQYRATP